MAQTTDQPPAQQARQIAFKVPIKSLANATFVQNEGWTPSFVIIEEKHISRVNIIGVVVELEQPIPPFTPVERVDAVLDDGTGSIRLRSFENISTPTQISIGSIVRVVGKIKKYQDQIYLVPEIIRSVDAKVTSTGQAPVQQPQQKVDQVQPEPAAPSSAVPTTGSKLLELVDKLDRGEGAMQQEIYDSFAQNGVADPEKKLHQFLLSGDCFEIRPGRIKVLK